MKISRRKPEESHVVRASLHKGSINFFFYKGELHAFYEFDHDREEIYAVNIQTNRSVTIEFDAKITPVTINNIEYELIP